MNIRDLKYLVALAECRHFGKAAKLCFVSQPTLSMQIKKLEDYLGVKLLERTQKSVLLTNIGNVVAERARIILQQVDELRDVAKLAKDPYQGEVKIGIIPTLAPYLLPPIIPRLAKKFPQLQIYLVEEQTALLLEKLKQGKLDAAFLALPVTEKDFIATPLFAEEFVLAVPGHHTFSKRKNIKQTALADKTLLLLTEGHCMREQALAVCHSAQAKENKSFRATSLETLRHMVATGAGITLMPQLACKTTDGVAYVPFIAPQPSRTIGLLWRATSAKAALFKDIAQHIKLILAKQNGVRIIN